jgi:DNA-binding NarL/FixJ family response regulator
LTELPEVAGVTWHGDQVLVKGNGNALSAVVSALAREGIVAEHLPAELLRAVRAAARGQSVLSPTVASRVLAQVRSPPRDPLSERELEVLALIARGATNRDAAAQLFISEATVKTHLLHIYAKLGVGDRAAAVAEAFNRGLLTPQKR